VINRGIGRYLVKPGREPILGTVRFQRTEGLHKGFLNQIIGDLLIPDNPKYDMEDRTLMPDHQVLECLLVAVESVFYQFIVNFRQTLCPSY
jgi:hypothetical protein